MVESAGLDIKHKWYRHSLQRQCRGGTEVMYWQFGDSIQLVPRWHEGGIDYRVGTEMVYAVVHM